MGKVFRARWVLPIAQPPIRHGWIVVEGTRIAALGGAHKPAPPSPVEDVAGAILPGLVNAHTHLELSYLRGRIPPALRFGDWVRTVMRMRQQYPDPAHADIVGPARQAIAEARASGTAVVGDVSNTLVTVPLLREAEMPAQVFYELTGFAEQDPEGRVRDARARADATGSADVRVSVAPHAPYSVSAALFRAIREDIDAHPDAVSSVHLGETPEEVELLKQGTGEIRRVLEEIGRWPEGWRPPGVGPVEYLLDLAVLDSRTLAVHGVQFDESDVDRLRERHVTIVSCPRSNVRVGVGSPPLERFFAAGVEVAFGTDSLASVADLNLFAELAEARRIAPGIPARRLLESATLTGARALRFDDRFGSIEPGKDAALVAVTIPAGVSDVEEYLVSGVEPRDIRWLKGER